MMGKCQCCGGGIFSSSGYGKEADGTDNLSFCSDCYKNGCFIENDSPVLHDKIYPFKRIFEDFTSFVFSKGP